MQVALILSGASGHYWENIVEGAQTAADAAWTSPCAATCRTRKRRSGSRTCGAAARDGADALVVASQGQQELLDALEGIDLPLIAVGTQIEGAEAAVLNDDAKMGQSVAQALAASLAEGDGVLLLADSAEYRETDLRETSLRENLAAKGVTVRGRFFSGDQPGVGLPADAAAALPLAGPGRDRRLFRQGHRGRGPGRAVPGPRHPHRRARTS